MAGTSAAMTQEKWFDKTATHSNRRTAMKSARPGDGALAFAGEQR